MSQLFEPAHVLCAKLDVLPHLASAIVDLGIPLLLRRLPVNTALTQALQKAYSLRGVVLTRPDIPWPWITLDASWAEPENKYPSKRRSYLRRARRIAEEFGSVSTEILTPTPTTLQPLLEEVLNVEASCWKGKTETALAMDPVVGAFYRRYAAAACEQGVLRLSFLRIGGRAIAMQLGVESDHRLWLLKIGYDEQFAHCSPGSLLVLEAIRYAVKKGLWSIGFLGTMEPLKLHWTSEKNTCVTLRAYPIGYNGMTTLAGDLTKYAWHKLGRALAPQKSSCE